MPARAKIHAVFHVSLLKPFVSPPPISPSALLTLLHGRVYPLPAKVLKSRRARDRLQRLVQWENAPTTSASWEDFEHFQQLYPLFKFEDELFEKEGRDVMWGLQYSHHKKETPGGWQSELPPAVSV